MDAFIGRFHPLIVHLPIGFIMLAFILESLGYFVKSFGTYRKMIMVMYFSAFLVSVAAVASGLMISENGAYGPGELGTHKTLGIVVMVYCLALALIKWKKALAGPRVSYAFSVILVFIVSLTGHYGGILTHGSDYLYENAPGWFQAVSGYEPHDGLSDLKHISPDSVRLYDDVVRPILEARCVRCHNEREAAGGFNASGYQQLFDEGETGTAVVPGNLASSELFRRVSLPTTSTKYMPPNGHPLSYAELNIIRYWIESGADSISRFEYSLMDDELARVLKRDYALDVTPRPYYEKVSADSLPPEVLSELKNQGFIADYLGGDNFFLDVAFAGDTLDGERLSYLDQVRRNITFLDLSDAVIVDSSMHILTEIPHLTRLDLHGSQFSDNIFDGFERIEHLEVLNLFNTSVTSEGLEKALTSPGLKRVYLWQTGLTEDQIDQASSQYPGINFDRGFSLVAPDTTASSGAP